jgi:cell wall assembly regulator SMI1
MQDLLQRLEQWLQEHRPDYASHLQPGLSLEEIAEITEPLPFRRCIIEG